MLPSTSGCTNLAEPGIGDNASTLPVGWRGRYRVPVRRALIILAAAAVGAAAAWWFLPAWQTAQALEMIVADDPDTRTAGWRRLLDADETAMTRPDPALLRRIDERLAHHPADPTLIDAHDALRGVEAFDWEQLSQEVVLNAAAALARTRAESRARQTLELLNQCPLDAPLPDVGEALAPLFDAADESIRLEAIDVACRWAGEERIDALAELFLDHPSTKLRRRGWLAMAWAQEWPPLDPPALSRTDAAPIDVAEAILYAASRQGVDVTDPALDLRQGEMNGLPIAYLLRPIDTPDARRAIDDLAEGGDVLAQRVRQMRSDPREIPVLRRAALDPEESPGLRRLAAWRLDGLDVPSVLKILAADPADDRGSVYAAAMLAERLLPDDRAADLAREWIASFDDDFKRAGALLSALLGANADLLREAYEAEDMPEVREWQWGAYP